MTASKAARRGFACAAAVGILTFGGGALTRAAEPDWQSAESIRAAARAAVLATLAEPASADIEAVAVDERIKLPACAAPLEAGLERAVRNGQATVAVGCAGPERWRLFVPVRVVEQVAVLVAERALAPGQVLTPADFSARMQRSTSLPYDYLVATEAAAGLTVRRTIPAGTVLAAGMLEAPTIVARGALVTLISRRGPVSVKSEGVALEPARLNERVRVRSRSGRVVEGTVEPSGEVRVGT